jgi:hypothetical protein
MMADYKSTMFFHIPHRHSLLSESFCLIMKTVVVQQLTQFVVSGRNSLAHIRNLQALEGLFRLRQ